MPKAGITLLSRSGDHAISSWRIDGAPLRPTLLGLTPAWLVRLAGEILDRYAT
jgi:hypothetical protein